LSVDPVVQQNGWEVAVWFDVLTALPLFNTNAQQAYGFYSDMEEWIIGRFGAGYRQMPEWSKGWAYTADNGPWTNQSYIAGIKETFTTGRNANDTWAWEVETLAKYDAANLFTNPFLTSLFTP
ncbi:MAG TPA: cholesterol oxidase substrate-binding domain-containing protein, partial [Blastocatellia bacterium]